MQNKLALTFDFLFKESWEFRTWKLGHHSSRQKSSLRFFRNLDRRFGLYGRHLIATKSWDEKLTPQLLFLKMLLLRPYREHGKSCVFRVCFVLSVAFYSRHWVHQYFCSRLYLPFNQGIFLNLFRHYSPSFGKVWLWGGQEGVTLILC